MREERRKQSNVERRRKEGRGRQLHCILQAVNNLKEHWEDKTKMNTKHWQHLT